MHHMLPQNTLSIYKVKYLPNIKILKHENDLFSGQELEEQNNTTLCAMLEPEDI